MGSTAYASAALLAAVATFYRPVSLHAVCSCTNKERCGTLPSCAAALRRLDTGDLKFKSAPAETRVRHSPTETQSLADMPAIQEGKQHSTPQNELAQSQA